MKSVRCECGCGDKAKPGNRFIVGHNNRLESNKQTLREKATGRRHSPETRQLISRLQRGKVLTEDHRHAISDGVKRDYALKGGTHTPETRAKMSRAMLRRLEAGIDAVYFDTKPELAVQAALDGKGVVYRKQVRLPGIPALWDFLVPRKRLIIEVHGCYWHGCRPCGHGEANAENVARDVEKASAATADGWKLLVVWEHDIKTDKHLELLEVAC